MTARKRIGTFLVAFGLLVLASAGFLWRHDAPGREKLRTERVALSDSASRLHAELVKVSLRQQAFHKTKANAPDTLKRYGANILLDIGNSYNKHISRLERDERDVNLKISAIDRRAGRAKTRVRTTITPVAAAGLAALLAGAVLVLLPARRSGT